MAALPFPLWGDTLCFDEDFLLISPKLKKFGPFLILLTSCVSSVQMLHGGVDRLVSSFAKSGMSTLLLCWPATRMTFQSLPSLEISEWLTQYCSMRHKSSGR
jgi:hypothetical protein